jgi:hypothetical protein
VLHSVDRFKAALIDRLLTVRQSVHVDHLIAIRDERGPWLVEKRRGDLKVAKR